MLSKDCHCRTAAAAAAAAAAALLLIIMTHEGDTLIAAGSQQNFCLKLPGAFA
jgi:hypothetical protein